MELNNWLYFREIQIDATNINMNLTDWLVAIKLDSNNFDFSKTQPSGDDIRFTDSDGRTLLNYYVEDYNHNNQEATIWVKVPSIPANQTKSIYIWYGNPNAVSRSDQSIMASGSQYDPDPFNDNSCLAFYPLDGDANDYSGNGHHGMWHGNEQYDDGLFGQCAKFDGSSYISTSDIVSPLSSFTISLWAKKKNIVDDNSCYYRLIGWGTGGSNDKMCELKLQAGKFWIAPWGSPTPFDISFDYTVGFNHYMVTYNNGFWKVFANGRFIGNWNHTLYCQSNVLNIGNACNNNDKGAFKGVIDQVRIFNRTLTENEITLLSYQLPYSIGDEIFHGSKLSGVVCDKYGIPIVDKPVKIFIFDKDSGKLYRTTTSDKGKWEADHLPVAENSKVLVVYTLEGNYREDNDLVGGEFSITQPL